MKNKFEEMVENLNTSKYKVVAVTKDNYTLENGDVYEHTFEIPDDITVEEFQEMLDRAKETLKNTMCKDE
jgi:hypothetical protein